MIDTTRPCTRHTCGGTAHLTRDETSAALRYRTFVCVRCGHEQVQIIRPQSPARRADDVLALVASATQPELIESHRRDRTGERILVERPSA